MSLSKVALCYGQMSEPPGARNRIALTGLTMAEYFRDEMGLDVLMFIEVISLDLLKSGSEMSVYFGRNSISCWDIQGDQLKLRWRNWG